MFFVTCAFAVAKLNSNGRSAGLDRWCRVDKANAEAGVSSVSPAGADRFSQTKPALTPLWANRHSRTCLKTALVSASEKLVEATHV